MALDLWLSMGDSCTEARVQQVVFKKRSLFQKKIDRQTQRQIGSASGTSTTFNLFMFSFFKAENALTTRSDHVFSRISSTQSSRSLNSVRDADF